MRYLILAIALWFTVSGCKPKKEEGNFKIQLQVFVGSQPLSFANTIYNDGNGKDFYFSKLKFFLSHVKLVKSDNTEVEIEDVAFFDFDDNDWKSFSAQVDAGTYAGLKFSVGLDPAQNATDPDNYSSSEALGPKNDMYWDWQKHRFIVLEGSADTTGNNFNGGTKLLAYHVGTDVCYRQAVVSGSSFTVDAENDKQINLNLDLLKVFYSSTDTIDMFTENATQSGTDDLIIAERFAEQFSRAFSYSE